VPLPPGATQFLLVQRQPLPSLERCTRWRLVWSGNLQPYSVTVALTAGWRTAPAHSDERNDPAGSSRSSCARLTEASPSSSQACCFSGLSNHLCAMSAHTGWPTSDTAAHMQAAWTAGQLGSGGRTWTTCGQLLEHGQCQSRCIPPCSCACCHGSPFGVICRCMFTLQRACDAVVLCAGRSALSGSEVGSAPHDIVKLHRPASAVSHPRQQHRFRCVTWEWEAQAVELKCAPLRSPHASKPQY
jgi:hypothetical protein